jgi:hypothetical protein
MILTPAAKAGCDQRISAGIFPAGTAHDRTMDAVTTAEPRTAEAPAFQSILGLWLTTLKVGGQTFGVAFEAFTSGGIEILNDAERRKWETFALVCGLLPEEAR